ncbi:MAG: S16 family serine protease [archaeon]
MNKIKLMFVLFLVFLIPVNFAVIEKCSMPIFAVITGNGGAIKADLSLELKPGTGKVYSLVESLVGTSTQNTEKSAVEVSKNYFKDVDKYNYFFDINSDASIVEGPSAGAAMGLLTVSCLTDAKLPEYVSATGTLDNDGYVSAVGGVFAKAKKAAEVGIKLFFIPEGESIQTQQFPDNSIKTVDLREYAYAEWGIKIIEVRSIDDMLKYAFVDLNTIDPSQFVKEDLPNFIPESIPLNEKLNPMKEFTDEYVNEAQEKLKSAKGSLSNTILQDSELLNALMSSLNSSEKTIEDAKNLLGQNYLYSAANYAFLALVNASLVEDIVTNPSLMEINSKLLNSKINSLEEDLVKLEKKLNNPVSKELFEWQISAQERLIWAKMNIEQLKQGQQITIEGDILDVKSMAISNILDYEYAKQWLNIAKNLYTFSLGTGPYADISDKFGDLADQYQVKAEDVISILNEESKGEDILRRINASSVEKAQSWNLSSALDAASAYGLAQGEATIEGKSVGQLIDILDKKINSLNSDISKSNYPFVWARLYLDHANYFLKAAKFYEDKNSIGKAKEMALSGVTLIFMATEVHDVMNSAYEKIGAMPNSNVMPSTEPDNGSSVLTNNTGTINLDYVLISVIIILILVILALLVYMYRAKLHLQLPEAKPKVSITSRIEEIKKMQHKLDDSLVSGTINMKHYEAVSERYKQELKDLLEGRAETSKHVVEVDRVKAELYASQHLIRDLKHQFKRGEITREDYERNIEAYKEKISGLTKEIEQQTEIIKDINKMMVEHKQKPKEEKPARDLRTV